MADRARYADVARSHRELSDAHELAKRYRMAESNAAGAEELLAEGEKEMQEELVSARATLVTAQRDRVVASYAVLSAVGMLSAEKLRLRTEIYDARKHYDQVKGLLWGTETPDGR